MKIIFKTLFGSHVYGINTPTSDLDYKSVFIPDPRDIVLQKVQKTVHEDTKTDPSKKNTPEDIDHEMFSLQEFLKLLAQGQTVALDMLFTPESFYIQSSPEWETILACRNKFLHKGTSAFVGYTKAQAAKYGVKGFRVAALRAIIEMLNKLPPKERLAYNLPELKVEIEKLNNEYIRFTHIPGANNELEEHLEVCNRKVNVNSTIEYALSVFNKIFQNYGQRALMAERNEGIDWKALTHAVRVAHEAEELLLTGKITFPRPEKDLLFKIKTMQMPYGEVANIIDQGLIKVQLAQDISKLSDKPDIDFMNDLVYNMYSNELRKLYGK
jgi:predicted nucleotidyltransferase